MFLQFLRIEFLKIKIGIKEMSNMSRYKEGKRDGRNNTYNPPHGKGFIRETIEGLTNQEKKDARVYRQGFRHGRKSRR